MTERISYYSAWVLFGVKARKQKQVYVLKYNTISSL